MKNITSLSILSTAVLIGLVSSSAYAGFEWRPPQDLVASQEKASGSVMLDEQSNILNTETAVKIDRSPLPVVAEPRKLEVPVPKSPMVPVAKNQPLPKPVVVDRAPIITNTTKQAAPLSLTDKDFSMPAPSFKERKAFVPQNVEVNLEAAAEQGVYQVIEGFGKKVPLLVAVRQVVPVDYEFYFNKDVDVGGFVSWEGGRSWQRVLADALSPNNLTFTLVDNIVSIYKKGSSSDLVSDAGARLVKTATPPATTKTEEAIKKLPVQEKDISQVIARLPQGEDVDLMSGEEIAVEQDRLKEEATEKLSLPSVVFQKPKRVEYQTWYGSKGETLRSVLKKWTEKEDIDLYWDCEFDYPLQATFVTEGSFEEAVQKILEGFDQAQPRPLGRLHKNSQEEHAVLVVEANGLIR